VLTPPGGALNPWSAAVNAMTSSKTTVLGVRLDHERRAWVEAEAARQGLSVRALFESMIDQAIVDRARAYDVPMDAESDEPADEEAIYLPWVEPELAPPHVASNGTSPSCELGQMVDLSGQMVRVAFKLTGAVITTGASLAVAPIRIALRSRRR
jgi:hypothetical protein